MEIYLVDLVEACLDKIKILNPVLNACTTVIEEEELYNQAQIDEKEIKQGNYLGPLHGVPFSIRDIFYAKGFRYIAGSKILSSSIPSIDLTAVDRMKKSRWHLDRY
jgi:aspartyl-tRNA(Asn)/glutamyl-tRNA(Gln) amidotransferase subunit A